MDGEKLYSLASSLLQGCADQIMYDRSLLEKFLLRHLRLFHRQQAQSSVLGAGSFASLSSTSYDSRALVSNNARDRRKERIYLSSSSFTQGDLTSSSLGPSQTLRHSNGLSLKEAAFSQKAGGESGSSFSLFLSPSFFFYVSRSCSSSSCLGTMLWLRLVFLFCACAFELCVSLKDFRYLTRDLFDVFYLLPEQLFLQVEAEEQNNVNASHAEEEEEEEQIEGKNKREGQANEEKEDKESRPSFFSSVSTRTPASSQSNDDRSLHAFGSSSPPSYRGGQHEGGKREGEESKRESEGRGEEEAEEIAGASLSNPSSCHLPEITRSIYFSSLCRYLLTGMLPSLDTLSLEVSTGLFQYLEAELEKFSAKHTPVFKDENRMKEEVERKKKKNEDLENGGAGVRQRTRGEEREAEEGQDVAAEGRREKEKEGEWSMRRRGRGRTTERDEGFLASLLNSIRLFLGDDSVEELPLLASLSLLKKQKENKGKTVRRRE